MFKQAEFKVAWYYFYTYLVNIIHLSIFNWIVSFKFTNSYKEKCYFNNILNLYSNMEWMTSVVFIYDSKYLCSLVLNIKIPNNLNVIIAILSACWDISLVFFFFYHERWKNDVDWLQKMFSAQSETEIK